MDENQQRMLDVQKMVWSLGDYSRVQHVLRPIARDLVDACGVGRGDRFLDVGTGTGNLAIEAASRGADVAAVDPTLPLMEIGKARPEAAELSIDWREGHAADLPFEDGSFDFVGSVMGAMFAPDADAAVREMLRVTKPGGKVAMTAWTSDGYTGRTLKITANYMPPPPEGTNTAGEWGDEDTARSRFARYSDEVEVRRGTVEWRFDSEEDSERFFREDAPPAVAAKMALPPERYEEMVAEATALREEFNTATDGTVVIPAEYLMVIAAKRA